MDIREYIIDPGSYMPIISGGIDELIRKTEKLQDQYKRTIKFFQKILRINQKNQISLEDWLIIPTYQFIWDEDTKALEWFEDIFKNLDDQAWEILVDELAQQTQNQPTHVIGDKIYDYLLHVYAAVYLFREKYFNIRFPQPVLNKKNDKSVDITAQLNEQQYAIECKFIHTSKKLESFWWRYNRLCSKHTKIRKRPMFSAQYNFPPAEEIKSLTPLYCQIVKAFTKETYLYPDCHHIGTFKNKDTVIKFEYDPNIIPQSPVDCTMNLRLQKALIRTCNAAAEQLNKSKYNSYHKIIFLGLQPDPSYLSPWGNPTMETKQKTIDHYQKRYGIKIIFSEDAGFPVDQYL